MVGNVAARLPRGVAVQPVQQPFAAAQERGHRVRAPHPAPVAQQHVEQGLQVRRGPPAIHVGFAEAEFALARDPREEARVEDIEARGGSGGGRDDAEDPAIGQREIDRPDRDPLKDLKGDAEPSRQIALSAGGGKDRLVGLGLGHSHRSPASMPGIPRFSNPVFRDQPPDLPPPWLRR